MGMSAEEIESRIRAAFPDAELKLDDLAGDNDHWQITVISEAFRGLPRIRQHRMVYDALGSDMGTTLHALSVRTSVPS